MPNLIFPLPGKPQMTYSTVMSSIPPKHTPGPAGEDTPETGGGLVAMYHAASQANAESFPVLKAFQDYLEAERSQARRRVMQLSVFFAVLMGVVVTGFLTAGIFMWRNMAAVQNKLLDVALAVREPAPQPAPQPQPPAVSPVLEESVRQMSRAAVTLQDNLDRKLDGVSVLTEKVHARIASQDGELEKLRGEMRSMLEQSAKLKDELVTLRNRANKPAPPPQVAQARPPAPAAAPRVAAPASATPALPPPAPAVAVKPAPDRSAPPAPAAPAAPAPARAVAAATPAAEKPAAVAAAVTPHSARDARFPPAVKAPPVTPAGVTAPDAPRGMVAATLPIRTKNLGNLRWHVLLPAE